MQSLLDGKLSDPQDFDKLKESMLPAQGQTAYDIMIMYGGQHYVGLKATDFTLTDSRIDRKAAYQTCQFFGETNLVPSLSNVASDLTSTKETIPRFQKGVTAKKRRALSVFREATTRLLQWQREGGTGLLEKVSDVLSTVNKALLVAQQSCGDVATVLSVECAVERLIQMLILGQHCSRSEEIHDFFNERLPKISGLVHVEVWVDFLCYVNRLNSTTSVSDRPVATGALATALLYLLQSKGEHSDVVYQQFKVFLLEAAGFAFLASLDTVKRQNVLLSIVLYRAKNYF